MTSKSGRGQHRKYRPRVFTEMKAAMLSGALISGEPAIHFNSSIMKAFVCIRKMLVTFKNPDGQENKNDREIAALYDDLQKY